MERLTSVLGLVVVLGTAYLMSTNRRAIDFKLVVWGIVLQFLIGLFILKTAVGKLLFQTITDVMIRLLAFADEGSRFVFGGLVSNPESFGFIFAFQVLPTIIFVSSFFAVLYYLGVMQKVVLVIAKLMARTMGTSGAESLAVAANIFVGQTEAPLVVRPYIERMTRSELLTMMTGGMAHIAGGVMAGYVKMGVSAGHLLTASVMAAPATMLISKMLVPETETPQTKGVIRMDQSEGDINIIDAAARGAADGMRLALNVAAMLIAFIALIAVVNGILGLGGFTLQQVLGYAFAPVAFVIGVPSQDVFKIGSLLGQKIVLNEFVAYTSLTEMMKQPDALDPRSIVIATYALCGFANFGSIGIQIGGIGGLAPSRKADLARFGIKALIAGSMVTFMTASIAGILV